MLLPFSDALNHGRSCRGHNLTQFLLSVLPRSFRALCLCYLTFLQLLCMNITSAYIYFFPPHLRAQPVSLLLVFVFYNIPTPEPSSIKSSEEVHGEQTNSTLGSLMNYPIWPSSVISHFHKWVAFENFFFCPRGFWCHLSFLLLLGCTFYFQTSVPISKTKPINMSNFYNTSLLTTCNLMLITLWIPAWRCLKEELMLIFPKSILFSIPYILKGLPLTDSVLAIYWAKLQALNHTTHVTHCHPIVSRFQD